MLAVPELLIEWERRRREGDPVTTEELCADRPTDLPDLRRRARRLEACDRLLGLAGDPVEPPDPAPARVSGYQIRRRLGRGGMGVVYEGWDDGLKRSAAVKLLRPGAAARPKEWAARFDRERAVVGRLDHDYIVPVYESGVSDGRPYLVMALVPGGTLADRAADLTGRGPLAVAAFLEKVARGVAAAHAAGVLHRDLKPTNILIDARGNPRVSDFGLAAFWGTDAAVAAPAAAGPPPDAVAGGLTHPGVQPGTPPYMAPEQFEPAGRRPGPAADVWALGVILYELLTGRQPFVGDTRARLADRVCRHPPPDVRRLGRRVPRWLIRVVDRCLAKSPADRYADAGALAAALDRGLRQARRRRLAAVWAGGVAALLSVGVVGGRWAFGGPAGEPQPAPVAFEETPAVRQALADLAAEREVVLVDDQGHRPFRKVFGADTCRESGGPGGLTLDSRWPGATAVEFLPDLPPGRFRVTAELQHAAGGDHSKVALYVGGREWASASGHHLTCLSVQFGDVGSPALAPPGPKGTNAVASFRHQLIGVVRDQPNNWVGREIGAHHFLAAAAGGQDPGVRTIEFVTTPEATSASWDGHSLRMISDQAAAAHHLTERATYPGPEPGDLRRGGVGLILVNAVVRVKSLKIAPLP